MSSTSRRERHHIAVRCGSASRCWRESSKATRDLFVPEQVGEYVRDHLPGSACTTIETSGHVPHLTDPDETAAAIRRFVGRIKRFLKRTSG